MIFAQPSWERLTIHRQFNATAESVFTALTDPKKVMKWWGPKGFTCPMCRIDLRVGGEYLVCMRSPKGEDYWSKGVYLEIRNNERIVVSDSFSDEHGNIRTASSVGLPGSWPSTLTISVDLHFQDGETSLILIHEGLPLQLVESCRAGWNEMLDRLPLALSKTQDML